MAFIAVPPDGLGKQVETNTPDGTNHRQVITLGDKTATTTATVGANGLEVNVTNTASVVATDGTNAITTLFDMDSGVGTQRVEGVSLRKTASGGSVELGTSTDPIRTDPTGGTVQPVSWSGQTVTAAQAVAASLNATVVGTGTFAVQSTNQANSGVDIGDVTINNASGASAVNIQDGGNAITVDGTVSITANSAVNVAQINGITTLMGNGVTGTGSQRVTIASDNTAFAVNSTLSAETTKVIGVTRTADGSGNLLTSTGAALDVNLKTSAASNISTYTAQINGVTPLMGNGATGTGSQRVTIASDNTAFTVNAQTVPTTSGGCTIFSANNAGTKAAVKASAGQIYGWQILNTTAAIAYVQLFNVASASVTVGSTAPDLVLGLPASGGATFSSDVGIAFGTAITVACTTTRAGASGASCEVAIFYK